MNRLDEEILKILNEKLNKLVETDTKPEDKLSKAYEEVDNALDNIFKDKNYAWYLQIKEDIFTEEESKVYAVKIICEDNFRNQLNKAIPELNKIVSKYNTKFEWWTDNVLVAVTDWVVQNWDDGKYNPYTLAQTIEKEFSGNLEIDDNYEYDCEEYTITFEYKNIPFEVCIIDNVYLDEKDTTEIYVSNEKSRRNYEYDVDRDSLNFEEDFSKTLQDIKNSIQKLSLNDDGKPPKPRLDTIGYKDLCIELMNRLSVVDYTYSEKSLCIDFKYKNIKFKFKTTTDFGYDSCEFFLYANSKKVVEKWFDEQDFVEDVLNYFIDCINRVVNNEPIEDEDDEDDEDTFAEWFGEDLTGQTYDGDIDCNDEITSLKGAPKIVNGDFSCNLDELTSLKYAPQVVNGDFSCSGNHLTTLGGGPQTVTGDFICSGNKLTSLRGAPQKVGGSFKCSYNQLTSLEGAPQEVGGDFYCYDNQLASLKGAPQEVGGAFDCDNYLKDEAKKMGYNVEEE